MRFLGLAAGPAWLLLTGSALAVVLFYLLKPTPRRLRVASSLIWQRLLRARQREPQRLRWWLSLLLALVIASMMALALTQPQIAAVSGAAEDHLLVIDNSPTMAARNGDGRTRLQHAIERAGDIVRAGGAGSRFLVVDTMHQLPVADFVSRAAALAQLQSITVRTGTTPWFPDAGRAPVEALGEGSVPANPRRLWLVTDGVAPLQAPAAAQVVSVFQSAPNVGITAFEVRALPADARRAQVFIEVSNAASAPAQVHVRLAGAGAAAIERNVTVAGAGSARLVLEASGFGEGALRASVQAEGDALDLDDTAYAYLPGKSRVRLALVTPGNADLTRALRLLPRIDVEVLSPARLRELGRFDAAILDRVAPAQAPMLPALLIDPPRVPWLASRAQEVSDIRIDSWDGSNALLSGVALRDVLIEHVAPLRATAPARMPALDVIAQGPDKEALMLATREGPRRAVLSFALDASNFALQPGFPGFLANTVDWLTREPRASAQRLGLVSLPLTGARVLDVDGQPVTTREVPAATLFDAVKPGLYSALAGDQRMRVAVNVLDAHVTAINGSTAAPLNAAAPAAVQALWTLDPWAALLLAAVVLLSLEWWAFHRRLTV